MRAPSPFGLVSLSLALAACSQAPTSERPSSAGAALSRAVATPSQAELDFEPGWIQEQHGAVVQGGQVSVVYTTSRMGSCASATIFSYARFLPGGEEASSDEAFSFAVPAGATQVQLWFHAVAPGCDEWDSNYGQNWAFPVLAAAPPAIGWAGNWASSTDRSCQPVAGVPEPITIDEFMREQSCIFVDAEVWVPGVTDVATTHPEWIQAKVDWAKDSAAPTTAWLDYEGISGHNAVFRWSIPYEVRDEADWNTVSYSFRFSTDGVVWTTIAQPSGADWTIVRAFTFSSSDAGATN